MRGVSKRTCRSSPGGKEEKGHLRKKEGCLSCDTSKKERVSNRGWMRSAAKGGGEQGLVHTRVRADTYGRVCLGVGGRGRFRQRL